MPLISAGKITPHDWSFSADGDPLPASGDVVISFKALLDANKAIFERAGRVGVALANNSGPDLIAGRLPWVSLITVDFPGFADGRGFSLAHELRRVYRYTGELWARGHLIPDQTPHLRACGFDAFLVDDGVFARHGPESWTEAATALNLRYQLSHGGYEGAPQSILALRRQLRYQTAAE